MGRWNQSGPFVIIPSVLRLHGGELSEWPIPVVKWYTGMMHPFGVRISGRTITLKCLTQRRKLWKWWKSSFGHRITIQGKHAPNSGHNSWSRLSNVGGSQTLGFHLCLTCVMDGDTDDKSSDGKDRKRKRKWRKLIYSVYWSESLWSH